MTIARNLSSYLREPQNLRSLGIPLLLAAVALGVAVVGAMILGRDSGVDGINGFIENLSGMSGSYLGNLGLFAPLGFAFAVGMVSAVNPCGFAMLPAYLGLYLGANDQSDAGRNPFQQILKGLEIGSSVTLGLVVLFGIAGTIIALGFHSVGSVLAWLGLGIGIILTVTGAWLVGGGKLYTGFAAQAASRIGNPGQVNVKGYFLFGISYGIASLSCTLPIFLSVIGTSFAASTILTSLSQFLLYGMGMGVVIMVLTLGVAFFKSAMLGTIRKVLPYVGPIGSWLMVIAGAYIVFYWLTIGGLL
jgi:cytochrome c-type biogenesis protein